MRVKYKKGKYVRETGDGWERYTIITPGLFKEVFKTRI